MWTNENRSLYDRGKIGHLSGSTNAERAKLVKALPGSR